MPRQARLDAPGTLHHVVAREIDGLVLFRNDQDRGNFISRLSQLVESTETKILAWALMDNHVHLLMFSGPPGISKFMRCLLTGYAIMYNRKYHRSGHLFQNRYKSIVSEEELFGERDVLVARVITNVCDEAGIKEEELRNGGRRRKVSHGRARISYHLSRELGIPVAEIARHLGVCTSAIAKAIQKLE